MASTPVDVLGGFVAATNLFREVARVTAVPSATVAPQLMVCG